MLTKITILAMIGALIGWVTNILAIRLIFRPINPLKIPGTNIQFQGLIPKRRNEIAKSIGETIEKELVTMEEILGRVLEKQNKSNILKDIKDKVQAIITQKIPALLPRTFRNLILNYTQEVLETELEPAINEFIEDFINSAKNRVRIGEMVENKINEFDLLKLDSIIISISRRELKQIEYLGGLLGFIIGILQGIIILLL